MYQLKFSAAAVAQARLMKAAYAEALQLGLTAA